MLGVCFAVASTFPICPGADRAYGKGVVAGAASLRTAAPPSVLVIDDDQDIREYLQDFLGLEGFEVTTLADPTVAIPRILGEVFQLIMLDLMMPKITGLDLLAQIRAVDDDIPVIIMTSAACFATAWASIERGISGYLAHPSGLDELRTLIARAVKERKKCSLHAAIGRLLRSRCQVRGLTLDQVARRANLSVSLLSQIERAEPSVSVSSLSAVAAVLGVSLAELVDQSNATRIGTR